MIKTLSAARAKRPPVALYWLRQGALRERERLTSDAVPDTLAYQDQVLPALEALCLLHALLLAEADLDLGGVNSCYLSNLFLFQSAGHQESEVRHIVLHGVLFGAQEPKLRGS